MVVSPEKASPKVALVKDLINRGDFEWNVELVKQCFSVEDASAILGIPLSLMGRQDRLIWAANKSGKFSVKLAYLLAYEEKLEQNRGDYSNASLRNQVWRSIWQLKLPHKLRHFAWKVGRNILATKDNLIRRKITEDATCVLCGQPEETTYHLLWFCKHAREVWESSKLALPFVFDQSWNFLDIVQNLQNREVTHSGLLEKIISVCWGIWKDRNDKRMGGSGKPGRVILKTALQHVDEYSAANDTKQGDKPVFEQRKKLGIGVVIWDESGEVVAALSKVVNAPLGVVEIEAKAMEAGVSFARDVGIREAVFEGDSLIICKALQGGGGAPSSIQNVLEGTREMASALGALLSLM
nr:uncharacterized protein LOC112034569 [Quercus suber]